MMVTLKWGATTSSRPNRCVLYRIKNVKHPLFDKHEKSKQHVTVAQAIANKQGSQEEISTHPLA